MADIDVSQAQVVHEVRSPERITADNNRATIEQQAVTALTANKTYANLASPTAAQTTAQVKAFPADVRRFALAAQPARCSGLKGAT